MFPCPSYLHRSQSACTSAQREKKTEQAQKTQQIHVQFKRKGTNLDGALGVVLTALALQLQHDLLGGFCLKKVTKLAYHTTASSLEQAHHQ
jgi:hypothetical protein